MELWDTKEYRLTDVSSKLLAEKDNFGFQNHKGYFN